MFNDFYFVVVYVYDYEVFVCGKRVFYWKISMMVNVGGVLVWESLLLLVVSGVFFFGWEIKEVVIMLKCF